MSDYNELIDKLRITGMTEGYCEMLLNAADAIERLEKDREDMRRQLCVLCGMYKKPELGVCPGCRWNKGGS